jgi:hypothetical protein
MDRLGDMFCFWGLDDSSAEVKLGSTDLMDAQKIVFFSANILIDKGGALILFYFFI